MFVLLRHTFGSLSRFKCDPKDPGQLRAVFSQEEIRKLYGRFQTARKREPKAEEDPLEATIWCHLCWGSPASRQTCYRSMESCKSLNHACASRLYGLRGLAEVHRYVVVDFGLHVAQRYVGVNCLLGASTSKFNLPLRVRDSGCSRCIGQ